MAADLRKTGIRMEEVAPGSPAWQMGLRAGDRCLAIDGRVPLDYLDIQYHLADGGPHVMDVAKADGQRWEAEFELDEDETLGIGWEGIRPRTCRNRCVFCFVDQLPRGVRPSLRIKDEDYRHSFLHGNFITLSNLTPADLDRILAQRLSPLYVSVHSTDPSLRARLVRCGARDRFFEYFDALARGGIALHTQVVLLPGRNDGAALERTMTDLAARHPAVRSLGIVPVGLTRHRAGLPALRPPDPSFCRAVIRQVQPHQERWRRRLGVRFAYLADEFYLQAGRRLPPASAYDDFPQLENGIGLVRDFLEETMALLREPPPVVRVRRAALATGTLFAPLLAQALRRINRRWGVAFRALPVPNRFLGPRVTVAGLLAGRDIAAAAGRLAPDEWLAVPGQCVGAGHGRFLDDWTPADLAAAAGRPVARLPLGAAGLRALAAGELEPALPRGEHGLKNL
ncbi:MAG TPA: DUF512 domain-containing protein [Acidobacteriota bacterium]|nr:DUF512 domain-containing protein [Acidobacteriota bacterium]HQF88792.1 DUF512 domain-containing protein [Acidobacteriota bacterium]HQG91197.1 DUF512 domain-containing protein [Acidobacteriota bacterium]HQK88215.1 DUF512 domain-containing protein [Acidobacteriota bacterium]